MPLTLRLCWVTLLLFQVSYAVPLEERVPAATGLTQNDPISISVDCSEVEEVCEAQCIAKLCFGAPVVLQHHGQQKDEKKKYSDTHRQQSGALSEPFTKRAPTLDPEVSVEMPPCNQDWTSPEDTTAASSVQGGYGTIIAPVDPEHNREEGSRFGGQISSNKVTRGLWYKKGYTNAGEYCAAFMAGTPSAQVQCTKNVNDDNDPINYMYRRSSKKRGNAYLWQKMTYGMTWVQSNNFPTT